MRWLSGIGLAATLALAGGCILLVAAVVGGALAAGTYAYVEGEGRQDYRVSLDKLYETVNSMCEKRGIAVSGKGIDLSNAYVDGKLKGSQSSVSFKMDKLTENTSRLRIRVGTFGDQQITQDLHNEVGRELEQRLK
jgi:hypothetical protein